MNEVTKPTLVAREEFMEQLVNLVNDSGLPLVLIEPIIDGLASNIKQTIANQLVQEKENYKKELEKVKEENFVKAAPKAKEEEKVVKAAPKAKAVSKTKPV